eukprot:COSAG01_NODE_44667_length_416_cov_5.782334_1_plen_24_part_10
MVKSLITSNLIVGWMVPLMLLVML